VSILSLLTLYSIEMATLLVQVGAAYFRVAFFYFTLFCVKEYLAFSIISLPTLLDRRR
jgi:hypothetical protein